MSGTEADSLPSVDELMDERAEARPDFIGEISGDRVLDAVMRLAMEVSVLRDELDVYEAVLSEERPDFRARLEAYRAPPELEAQRMQRRRTLIRRLLRDLR